MSLSKPLNLIPVKHSANGAAAGDSGSGSGGSGHRRKGSKSASGGGDRVLLHPNPHQRFAFLSKLGKGGNGTAYAATDKSLFQTPSNLCALKCVQIETEEQMNDLKTEIQFGLKASHHPNLVEFRRAWYIGSEAWIEMELCAGSLDSILRATNKGKLSLPVAPHIAEQIATHLARDVLNGLKHLHAMIGAHRDIKPGNVLLTVSGTAKLADYGAGAIMKNENSIRFTMIGTRLYAAPEQLGMTFQTYPDSKDPSQSPHSPPQSPPPQSLPQPVQSPQSPQSPHSPGQPPAQGYDRSVDVWSVGIMMYQILGGTIEKKGAFYNTLNLPRLQDVSDDANHFIFECCLQIDPKKRYAAAQLLEHPWLKRPTDPAVFKQWSDVALSAARQRLSDAEALARVTPLLAFSHVEGTTTTTAETKSSKPVSHAAEAADNDDTSRPVSYSQSAVPNDEPQLMHTIDAAYVFHEYSHEIRVAAGGRPRAPSLSVSTQYQASHRLSLESDSSGDSNPSTEIMVSDPKPPSSSHNTVILHMPPPKLLPVPEVNSGSVTTATATSNATAAAVAAAAADDSDPTVRVQPAVIPRETMNPQTQSTLARSCSHGHKSKLIENAKQIILQIGEECIRHPNHQSISAAEVIVRISDTEVKCELPKKCAVAPTAAAARAAAARAAAGTGSGDAASGQPKKTPQIYARVLARILIQIATGKDMDVVLSSINSSRPRSLKPVFADSVRDAYGELGLSFVQTYAAYGIEQLDDSDRVLSHPWLVHNECEEATERATRRMAADRMRPQLKPVEALSPPQHHGESANELRKLRRSMELSAPARSGIGLLALGKAMKQEQKSFFSFAESAGSTVDSFSPTAVSTAAAASTAMVVVDVKSPPPTTAVATIPTPVASASEQPISVIGRCSVATETKLSAYANTPAPPLSVSVVPSQPVDLPETPGAAQFVAGSGGASAALPRPQRLSIGSPPPALPSLPPPAPAFTPLPIGVKAPDMPGVGVDQGFMIAVAMGTEQLLKQQQSNNEVQQQQALMRRYSAVQSARFLNK